MEARGQVSGRRGAMLTDALTIAWNVLTASEQPSQSRALVVVVVEAKTVLVPSVG